MGAYGEPVDVGGNGHRPMSTLGGMVDATLKAQAASLPVEDRLELIAALWESLSADEVSVDDEERALLDERLAALESRPELGRNWDEVERDLRSRIA